MASTNKTSTDSIRAIAKTKFNSDVAYDKPVSLRNKLKNKDLHFYIWNEASSQPFIPSSKQWNRAILMRVSARGLEQRYSEMLSRLIEEVHNDFLKATHQVGVNCTIKPVDASHEGHFIAKPYKFLGRTPFHWMFLSHKKTLERRLFITYTLIRKIHRLCVEDLPERLIDFSQYRLKVHTLADMRQYLDQEVSKAKNTLSRWYNNITSIVNLDQTRLPSKLDMNYLGAGTGLMSVYLSHSVQTSIEHFIDVIQNTEFMPYFHMTLHCENDIYLEPSQLDILHIYQGIITTLVSLSDRFNSLQSFKYQNFANLKIPILISNQMVNIYMEQVINTVDMIFRPVTTYIKGLNEEFAIIFKEKCSLYHKNDTFQPGINTSESETVSEVYTNNAAYQAASLFDENAPSEHENYPRLHAVNQSTKSKLVKLASLEKYPNEIRKVNITSRNSSVGVMKHATGKTLENIEFNSDAPIKELSSSNYIISQFISQNLKDESVLQEDITFDQGYASICEYHKLRTKLNLLVNTEYFNLGKLSQRTCRSTLLDLVYTMEKRIARNLVLQHIWCNEDICENFQMIFEQAQAQPETTGELTELGNFMTLANSKLIPQFYEQIETSISITLRLLDVTTLSKEHIELNARTVTWIQNIAPVVEKSLSMLETWRFDFEEYLQKVIKDLQTDIMKFGVRLEILDEMNDMALSNKYLTSLAALIVKISMFDKIQKWINNEEILFKYPPTDFPEIRQLKQHIFPFHRLIEVCISWRRSHNSWMDGPLEFVDFVTAETMTEEYLRELISTEKWYRNSIKQGKSENYTIQFKGVLDDPDPLKHPSPIQLCSKTIQEIKLFETHLNIMRIMCNDALLQRHWDEMSEIAGYDVTPDARTTVRKLISMGFQDNLQKYEVISTGALKEKELLQCLINMKKVWDTILFQTIIYLDSGTLILDKSDDIQVILDAHIIKTLSLKGSVFVKPYASDIEQWYDLITRIHCTLEECHKVQSLWLHMLPIFSTSDIFDQIPTAVNLFQSVDSIYRAYMESIHINPIVVQTAGSLEVLANMKHCRENLELVGVEVSRYLDKKRLFFPRFFFLTNVEMVEIISQSKCFSHIQPYLSKCFEGIHTLKFGNEQAMVSDQQEQVVFSSTIEFKTIRDGIEIWFAQVENEMKATIRQKILFCLESNKDSHQLDWIVTWPEQIVLLVTQINWTSCIEIALESATSLSIIHENIDMDLLEEIKLVQGNLLCKLNRGTITNLILINIYVKNVTKGLIENKVQSNLEFQWLIQMQYSFEDECVVKMLYTHFKYAYEYLGNNERLVIMPQTDKCFRSLIISHYMHMSGSIQGYIGTGKTETFRELAKLVGVFSIVFNCCNRQDHKIIGKLLKGAASSGTWLCFKDTHKIEPGVLSVVAQQMKIIISAFKGYFSTCLFEQTELTLRSSYFVCITGSTFRKEGPTNLPDNLRLLFRTVTLVPPDYKALSEIILCSNGFECVSQLSDKIFSFYRFLPAQLSYQNHYNFGIRALKAVLKECVKYKGTFPGEQEDTLLQRSLCDIHKFRLVNSDIPIFECIMSDLFPCKAITFMNDDTFAERAKQIFLEKSLQIKPDFLRKIFALGEMSTRYCGVMIIGDPFSGKSTNLKVLSSILKCTRSKEHIQVVNPKSLTIGQLYGGYNFVTNEWYDGVLTQFFRRFETDNMYSVKWLVLDGPIDAGWIEVLNTVLDDSKKLCLLSGECINISPEINIIFEATNVDHCSPSMVSRCGIIYMDCSTIEWQCHVTSWILNSKEDWKTSNSQFIQELFEWMAPPSLQFINNQSNQSSPAHDIHLLRSTMTLIDMILNEACADDFKKEDDPRVVIGWIQAAILSAGVWGLGGILCRDYRDKFDEFYKALWRGQNDNCPYPTCMEKLDIPIPSDGKLFDYTYIYKGRGNWKIWSDSVKDIKICESLEQQDVVVPTADSIRYIHLVDMHIRNRTPVILSGPTGTGKTLIIKDFLTNKLNQLQYEPAVIKFTVKISANEAQKVILSKLIKRKRGHYSGQNEKTCVILIDDLNLPQKDEYGIQTPTELLRQYVEHKSWYDLKDNDVIFLHNIILIGVMGPAGGSRQKLCLRFLRHFSTYDINELSDETVTKIFTSILFLKLRSNGFPNDVNQLVQQIVDATLDVYQGCIENLRPTPGKVHYLFNIRDIARIIFGCAMLKKESTDNKKIFPRLWAHEALRVLHDRLINVEDRSWLYHKIKFTVENVFKEAFEKVFESLEPEATELSAISLNKLMFGKYLDAHHDVNDRKYQEVTNIQEFNEIALKYMDEYNSKHLNEINLVLFKYALEHLSRVCRVLAMSCSNALLLGISGCGRQSLTKLASALMGHSFFQLETSKYDSRNWRNDLKTVVKETGGRGNNIVLLVTEYHTKIELFLQDIDNLMNTGEVPNMFTIVELQDILEVARLDAQGGKRNLDVSALEVFSFFTRRTREKLHVVFCLNPYQASLRKYISLYSSLINCCTIDWFEEWPEDALEAVADTFMKDVDLPIHVKESVVGAFIYFHQYSQHICEKLSTERILTVYVTPCSFIELLKTFKNLIHLQQGELVNNKEKFISGINKLNSATSLICDMQTSLTSLQLRHQCMSEKATAMQQQVEIETIEVEKASLLVKADEEKANFQAAEAETLKAECEADLAEAIPILEDAISALNTLKPTDITLVKSMKNPPDAIKLVMAAVCVMQDVKPDKHPDPSTGKKIIDYWGPSKRILGDIGFLQSLKDFDKDHIKPEIMIKIRKDYIPHKDFNPRVVAKASSAAEGLCKWIIAMDMYDKVAKEVAPKKEKLEKAEHVYAKTMEILLEKKGQVNKLEEKIAKLNVLLQDATIKTARLKIRVDLCVKKLNQAINVVDSLFEEKSRWVEATNGLQYQYDHLAGDLTISCGFLMYLSPYTSNWRQTTVVSWIKYLEKSKLRISPNFNFISHFRYETQIQSWYITGLPKDTFSTENALIQEFSNRWPLIIDPQQVANTWIKRMEKPNGIISIRFSSADYLRILEKCIESGKPLLIEGISNDLELPVDFKLEKRVSLQNLTCAGNTVSFNSKFKLYISCSLKNPYLPPAVWCRVTVINFSLSFDGLVDQLLETTFKMEKSKEKSQHESICKEYVENTLVFNKLENSILNILSSTERDLLEDQFAINAISNSLLSFIDVYNQKITLRQAMEYSEEIKKPYKVIAEYLAVLYFCISDLSNLHFMYQYSLQWFINMYVVSIEGTIRFPNLHKRITALKKNFTYKMYSIVSHSLYEKHKLIFSLFLVIRIKLHQNLINKDELDILFTQSAVLNPSQNPGPDWISNNSWNELWQLEQLPSFTGICSSFVINIELWKSMHNSVEFEEFQLPCEWQNRLTNFQALLLVKIINIDKLSTCVSRYITKELGYEYAAPPYLQLKEIFHYTTCTIPIIFILSENLDPEIEISEFSRTKNFNSKLRWITLGKNQSSITEKVLEQGQQDGLWICLQNCHLEKSCMPTLEQVCINIDPSNTNIQFRLWLITNPFIEFPNYILQNSIKIMNQPCMGLKQNLMNLYWREPLNQKKISQKCPGNEIIYSRLLYGLAFLRVIIQERRRYGSLGWNNPYTFNHVDFKKCVEQLEVFINTYGGNSFEGFHYIIGEYTYGSQMEDYFDIQLLHVFLTDLINANFINNVPHIPLNKEYHYGFPASSEYNKYVSNIKQFPNSNALELFGLPINAGITKNLQFSVDILQSLSTLQRHNVIYENTKTNKLMMKASDIKMNLPKDFDMNATKLKFKWEYSESMNMFVRQEMQYFNILLQKIRSSLQAIINAHEGQSATTSELEEISMSLLSDKIPFEWTKLSYPTRKNLPDFISDLITRLEFLHKWYEYGRPDSFWISAFFFTRSFLTAVLQNHARTFNIPIGELTSDFKVLKAGNSKQPAPEGAYIYGLFITGAAWNLEMAVLKELLPRAFYDTMPLIWLQPIILSTYTDSRRYISPLFTTSKRHEVSSNSGYGSNFICTIPLETDVDSRHWIKRSVVLLCQLD